MDGLVLDGTERRKGDDHGRFSASCVVTSCLTLLQLSFPYSDALHPGVVGRNSPSFLNLYFLDILS